MNMWIKIIIGLLGGLGLFLYGMMIMSEGLQKAAGQKLKAFIERMTRSRFMGVLIGTLVTLIIQSSSATSVMVVGLVNAGVMKLTQAVGILLGANIGTTITGQLVSLNITAVAPVMVMGGVVMKMMAKNEKKLHISEIFIGLGILFIGMDFLKNSLSPLEEVPWFKNTLVNFQHYPLLGIFTGFMITLILQSSSASMGLLLALASEGLIPLQSALYILYGDNIGTCTTALISSIGSSSNAKRVGVMHLTFNIIGTIIFALFLSYPLTLAVEYLEPGKIARQIANAHTLFNIINVILIFPFANILINVAKLVVKDKDEIDDSLIVIPHLDKRVLNTPFIAMNNVLLATLDMAQLVSENIHSSINAFNTRDRDLILSTIDKEHRINRMQKEIMEYLIALSNVPTISATDRALVDSYFSTLNDIERIGDHAENISELASHFIEENLKFDKTSRKQLDVMANYIFEGLHLAIEAMDKGNQDSAVKAIIIEEKIDHLEETSRQKLIEKLHTKESNIDAGILFLDLLSNLERISDHFKNISQKIIEQKGQVKYVEITPEIALEIQ